MGIPLSTAATCDRLTVVTDPAVCADGLVVVAVIVRTASLAVPSVLVACLKT